MEKHVSYQKYCGIWETMRDVIEGEVAIKAKTTKYLPGFYPEDAVRYEQYITRAYFLGATSRTLDALVGMVFRKPFRCELPDGLEFILENADGAGQSLNQVAKAACADLIALGRYILFVDYPADSPAQTKAEEIELALQPVILGYRAESLLNWKTTVIGRQTKLSKAVLAEINQDGKQQYRVLELIDGVYVQSLLDENEEVIVPPFEVIADGKPLDHIPLYICGAKNNMVDIDKPPLYDLAILNIAHYQTTADHRENLFIHGQLTLGVTTDLDSQMFKAANPHGIVVGSRAGHFLGASGGFHSVTVPESTALAKELVDLENKMIMLGARLIQRGGQAETAEAARINASAEASTLDTIVENLSEAIEAALEDCARFAGLNPEQVIFEMNKDFWEISIDYQTVMAIIQLGDAGIVARRDQRYMLRTGRIALEEGRSDEIIEEELESQGV